jgi:hypothetical protein
MSSDGALVRARSLVFAMLSEMSGERDLRRLVASMRPALRPGSFVVAMIADRSLLERITPDVIVREEEGLTVVLRQQQADAIGLAYDYIAAWITLQVHSALDAVGFTSAVSRALADAGMSCNIVAGYHHDHLLVPVERAQEALTLLRELSQAAA